MRNEITISVRAFPVVIKDQRTGEESTDMIVIHKEQLRAAEIVGQSSKELIFRLYNRQGFKVLDIGKPLKRDICVELGEIYSR